MKIFSIVAIIVGVIVTVFSIIDGNVLRITSAISVTISFIFFFYYSKDKSKKFITLSMVFLAIYALLSTIKMFTEKGYF